MNLNALSKTQKLLLGILFDVIGMITFFDIFWAPASAYLMSKMYKGTRGKVAGVFSFIEEILPGFDFIPSFTIMWLLTYVFQNDQQAVKA